MKRNSVSSNALILSLVYTLLFSPTAAVTARGRGARPGVAAARAKGAPTEPTAQTLSGAFSPAPDQQGLSAGESKEQTAQSPLPVSVPGNAVKGSELFVANLQAGDQVQVVYTSGIVTFDTLDHEGGCPYTVDADGISRSAFDQNNVGCYGQEWRGPSQDALSSAPHAGLTLRRNNSYTFVGNQPASFTAAGDEALYLGVNDTSDTAPNTGAFNVQVTITPATRASVFVPGNDIAGAERFVANLLAGDQVVVSSVTGTVDFNTKPLCTEAGAPSTVDADGLARSYYEDPNNALCYGNDQEVKDPLTGSNEGHAGLYMMRNAQKTFIGRAGASFTAGTNQQLFLGVNDGTGAGSDAPNSGGFNAQVTIVRPTPTLNISGTSVNEGDAGATTASFKVTLSQAGTQTVTVNYATADGTATAPADYTTTSGTLTFAPGETSKTVTVTVNGDTLDEADENFVVNLSNPTGASLGVSQGVCTIIDNDTPPAIYIGNATANEGDAPNNIFVNVSLSAPSGRTVTVGYATADGTATAPSDYAPASGTLTFSPGQTSKNITLTFNGDTVNENQETFFVNLSNATNASISNGRSTVTILDDDFPGFFQFSSASYSAAESAGSAVITVNRVGGSKGAASVSFATSNGTATAGQDYTATSGTLNFANGETSKTFSVPVINDALNEGNETVNLALSNFTDGSGPGSPTTATLTILDGAPPPSLSINDVSVNEGNAGTINAAFTVGLSSASGRTVTVAYATANGTATAGQDYTATSGTLTFSPGETSKTVNVPVIGDTLDEANETFTVNLSNAVNASIADAQGVGTILDDEHGTLQFSAVSYSVNENAGSAVITVTRTGGADGAATVHYATADGTAVAGSDYTTASGTLTFNQGETSKTFNVPVTNDALNEANETVALALTQPTGGASLGAQCAATLTIKDDDPLPTLSVNNVSVAEGNAGTANATFTVTLSAASGRSVTVNYATADGTATTANNDYKAASGLLNFNAGEKTKTLTVIVDGDAVVEPDETFFVNLSNATNASIAVAQGVGTITNDDSAGTLQFSAVSYSVNENAGAATITVTRTGGSNGAVSVAYATSNGTATAGQDYTATSGVLNFNAGETSKTFGVPVIDDTLDETTETLGLALSNPSGGATLGSPASATLSIVDNDSAPTLSVNDVSVTEGNTGTTGAVFTVSMSSASGQAVSVHYATADGTAKAGSDYTAASGTLTFNPGDTSKTFTVSVTGDATVELNETFTVNLSAPANASIARATGTCTIVNDDAPGALQFSASTYSVNENAGAATITVTRTGGSSGQVSVAYATANGTATAGNDYTATSGTLTFADGVTTKSFGVPVTNDTTDEPTETVSLALSNPSGGASLGAPASATLRIVDDDSPPTLSVSDVSVREGDTGTVAAVFNVRLSSASSQLIRVRYSTADGTANSGSDYAATSGALLFAPGETSKAVTVLVNGDTRPEPDETFSLDVSSLSLADSARGTCTILNDDAAGTIQFGSASYSVNEGDGAATITVTRTGGVSGAVSVNYATANGTATAGSDYTATSGTLTFADGETAKSFSVPVTDDQLAEGDETVNLALSGASGGATLGSRSTAVLTILDNNLAGQLQFSSPSYSVSENGLSAVITVTRVSGTGGAVSVKYKTEDGTATAGSDYTATSGTLNFAAGETTKTFVVPITDDAVAEGDETVVLSLGDPKGGATLGAQAQAVLTILDDDAQPSLSVGDVSVKEGDSGMTPAVFAVSLSAPSSLPVTVNYATADGTATAGSDYASDSGTLTFDPGETTKTVTVLVVGDAEQEDDETFFVNLSNPSGARLAQARGVGTIVNDDASGAFSFSATEYSVGEGDRLAVVTVTRTGSAGGAASVDYSTSDGSAKQKSDYTISLGTLRFAAGETEKTFNVLVTDDAFAEGDETVALSLSNPTGGTALGDTAAATLRIVDDDAADSSDNPVDEAQFFVRQHYHDFLNREPDAPGLQFWAGQIEACGQDTACRASQRANVSAAFFLSIEFQQTGFYAYRVYKAAFGNLSDRPVPVAYDDFVRDTRAVGQGVVVGQGEWQQQLEENKRALALAFVQRPDFLARYPGLTGAAALVNSLDSNAGGVLSDDEKSALISELSPNPADAASRADVLRKVAESAALQQKEFDRAFVLMQYFAYLRRNPDDAPDASFDGYNFWSSKLERFGGDFRRAEMVKAFITSTEYRQRFGEH